MTCACGRPIEINPATGKPYDSWRGDPQCSACHEIEVHCTVCGVRFGPGSHRTVRLVEDGIEFLCESCNERRTS